LNWRALLIISLAFLILLIPLYVYSTYPEVGSEEESLIESFVIPQLPFKPPRFLVGSIIHGSKKESFMIRPIIEQQDNRLLLVLSNETKCPLLFAGAYVDVSSGEVVLRPQIVSLATSKASAMRVVVLETPRGPLSVVLEVHVDGKRYAIAPRGR